ncbi:MAG TPA: hypothetical protein PK264_19745 [Hyphomicrobiaceae bacterium]|nr:hypothetical protein [Hyphomicrobiaceae bacterium]
MIWWARDMGLASGLIESSTSAGGAENGELRDVVLTARALRAEIYHLARLVTVVTSLLNALASGRRFGSGIDPMHYLPMRPLVLPAVLGRLTELQPAPACLATLASLELGLDRAISSLTARAKQPIGTSLGSCTALWRALAAELCSAIGEIDQLEELDGLSADDMSSELLLRYLSMVRDGQAPILDANGRVLLPVWKERRVDPRYVRPQPAWILRGEARQRIGLLDISRSGAGFAGVMHVTIGDRLAIELRGGRRIDGIVIWSSGDRCGTRHMQSLSPTDPLLVSGCYRETGT